MYGCRDLSVTIFLTLAVGGVFLVAPALDAWQFLLCALASSLASYLLISLVATGYVAQEHSSYWLEPQAANVGSRAPPTLSIS